MTFKNYLEKMHDILHDKDTYRLIDKDPTKKLTFYSTNDIGIFE